MEGAKELSMLYFNHVNEHIFLGLQGSISKRNGLISVYSLHEPLVEVFKVIQVHEKAFSGKHCIASVSWTEESYQEVLWCGTRIGITRGRGSVRGMEMN